MSQAFAVDSPRGRRSPKKRADAGGQSAGHWRGTKEPQGWDDPHEHKGAPEMGKFSYVQLKFIFIYLGKL